MRQTPKGLQREVKADGGLFSESFFFLSKPEIALSHLGMGLTVLACMMVTFVRAAHWCVCSRFGNVGHVQSRSSYTEGCDDV